MGSFLLWCGSPEAPPRAADLRGEGPGSAAVLLDTSRMWERRAAAFQSELYIGLLTIRRERISTLHEETDIVDRASMQLGLLSIDIHIQI